MGFKSSKSGRVYAIILVCFSLIVFFTVMTVTIAGTPHPRETREAFQFYSIYLVMILCVLLLNAVIIMTNSRLWLQKVSTGLAIICLDGGAFWWVVNGVEGTKLTAVVPLVISGLGVVYLLQLMGKREA